MIEELHGGGTCVKSHSCTIQAGLCDNGVAQRRYMYDDHKDAQYRQVYMILESHRVGTCI